MTLTETALVVIAVGVTAQTLLMAAGLVAGARVWRHVQSDVRELSASLDRRLDAVSARIDEAVVDARIAARAVETVASRAEGFMQDAASAAHSVRTAVTVPKALVLTGAASAAKWILGRLGPRHARPVRHVEPVGSADIF